TGRGGLPVAFALDAADEPPSASVGDVAELRDVDMDQRAGMVVLVSSDEFSRDPIDVAEPVDSKSHEHCVDGRGGQPEFTGDLGRAKTAPPPPLHDPLDHGQWRL